MFRTLCLLVNYIFGLTVSCLDSLMFMSSILFQLSNNFVSWSHGLRFLSTIYFVMSNRLNVFWSNGLNFVEYIFSCVSCLMSNCLIDPHFLYIKRCIFHGASLSFG